MPKRQINGNNIRWRGGWAQLDFVLETADGKKKRWRERLGVNDPAAAAKKARDRIAELERIEQIKRDQLAGRLPKPSELTEQTLGDAIAAWTANYRIERRKKSVPEDRMAQVLTNVSYMNRIIYAYFGGCAAARPDVKLDAFTDEEVDKFVARGGTVIVSALGPREMQQFKVWLSSAGYGGAQGVGLSHYFTHLCRVLRHAEMQDIAVRRIAWSKLGLVSPAKKASDRTMSTVEETAIMEALGEDACRVVRLGLLTILREQNLFDLRWRDIYADDDGKVRIHVLQKGSRPHAVPVLEEERALLDECVGHNDQYVLTYVAAKNMTVTMQDGTRRRLKKGARYPWTKTGFRRYWVQALEEAGIESRLTFHWATRATETTRAHLRGAPAASLMKRGGWDDGRSFARYTRANGQDVIDGIAQTRAAARETESQTRRKNFHVIKKNTAAQ